MDAVVIPAPLWLAGVPIHPISREGTVALLAAAMDRRHPLTVLYANAHAIVLAQDDPQFHADLCAGDLVFCDGMGVWGAASLRGHPLPERFTPPDWIGEVLAQMATAGQRLFLLGGKRHGAERLAARLQERFSGLQLRAHHGFFETQGAEGQAVLTEIRAFRPDLLLVGMGMPRQERWLISQRGAHGATVAMAVGALFDYLVGSTPRGPAWMTDHGLEWLARLWYEPRRLGRRYLIGLPRFAWYVATRS